MSQIASSASATGGRKIKTNKYELSKEMEVEMKKAFSKSIVKNADMDHELQSEATDIIISAVDSNAGNYEAAARTVKDKMDTKFGAAWHCVIGEGYGFDVTYQTKNCIYVYYQGKIACLLFKC